MGGRLRINTELLITPTVERHINPGRLTHSEVLLLRLPLQ